MPILVTPIILKPHLVYLRAEDGRAVAGYVLLVALVEVTLRLGPVAGLAGTFAKGQVRTPAGVGKVALGVAQIGQRAGHPGGAVLVLVGGWLELIQRRGPPHPLDAVSCGRWSKGWRRPVVTVCFNGFTSKAFTHDVDSTLLDVIVYF